VLQIEDWNETLTWMLMPTGRQWCQAVGRAFEGLGVTLATGAPLMAITKLGDGARQTVIADAIGVDSAALVRSLDALEAAGLVERRSDPSDRRARMLHLTPSGRTLADKLRIILDDFRDEVLAEVSDEDGAATVRVLRAIERGTMKGRRE
jgi:MarR family transcriptional regulator for hemolysin